MINEFSRQIVCLVGRSTKKKRRIWTLDRGIQQPGLLHPQVIAGKVDGLAVVTGRQHLAPDLQKFA